MRFFPLTAAVGRLLVPLCLGSTSFAGVTYVDASGNGQFTSIQPAIDAAIDGDVLLVRTGDYAGFTLDNRQLWIVADAGAQVRVNTMVIVRNTAANNTALLSGLEITGAPAYWPAVGGDGLSLLNNVGNVRLQGCTVKGGLGIEASAHGGNGGRAASITNSTRVALVGCSLTGGNGGGWGVWTINGGNGGHGVVTQGSVVALYDCVLKGGTGGDADYIDPNMRGGNGGDGCQVLDFGILSSGSLFQGGMGGSQAPIPGDGGNGLLVSSGQAQYIGTTFTGGLGGGGYYGNFGQSGLPQTGAGVFNMIAGLARKISASALAAENGTLQFNVSGEPGDLIWLIRSPLPGFLYSPSRAGVQLISMPALSARRPNAILPVSGTATVVLPVPDVAAGTPVVRQYWQCVVVNAAGLVRLGSALEVAVLNCSDLLPDCDGNGSCDSCDLLLPGAADCDRNGVPDICQPDCNANGIIDACDILNGTSIDQNHNGIPDECEPQTTWHVDVNASPGGNGSLGAPFQTLGAAFASAISGDTVRVANGVYQGSGNRDLDFSARELFVESSGGATNCILDCQALGRAFIVRAGVPSTARIQGFTIRNGKSAVNEMGGGVFIDSSSPIIRQCRFESCSAFSYYGGGGLGLHESSALIDGCAFVGNSSPAGGGGGAAIYVSIVPPRFVDCSFVNNAGGSGGGLMAAGAVSIERCLFHTNTAGLGGAIFAQNGEVYIDQCWIAGNTASQGGGITGWGSRCHVTSCTIVDNRATDRSGAAWYTGSVPVRTWRNNILWNNTSPNGTAIELTQGPLSISWCDIQGGQASVTVGAQGALTWGLGNQNQDPLFVDGDGPDNNPLTISDNDDRLSLASACLDAGENASVAPDRFDLDGDGDVIEPVPFDFDGHPRFVDIPSAHNTGSGVPPLVDLGAWERP